MHASTGSTFLASDHHAPRRIAQGKLRHPLLVQFFYASLVLVSLALFAGHGLARASETSREYWRGTITVQAHDGTACPETSGGQSVPYRRVMMLELSVLGSGRIRGFAWGDMVPTRLDTLELLGTSRPGEPADVVITGPSNALRLAWLPSRGQMSPGELSPSASLIFKTHQQLLSGQWRERMDANKRADDQCLWSEATILLERVNSSTLQDIAQEARALQESLELIEQQETVSAKDRWSPAAIAQLLQSQQALKAGGYGARALLPLMSKLSEQLALNQMTHRASPILAQVLIYLDALLDQGPIQYAAYVTHLTPLLRMAGMLQAAEQINRQAITALMTQGHSQSPELGRLLSGYGALLQRMQSYHEALKVYEQALAIEQAVKDGKHIGVVIALVNLSRVCESLGRADRARQLAGEASDLHEALGLGTLKMNPSGRGQASKV
jgi:tetratricopeptide (TPR) repeat protein